MFWCSYVFLFFISIYSLWINNLYSIYTKDQNTFFILYCISYKFYPYDFSTHHLYFFSYFLHFHFFSRSTTILTTNIFKQIKKLQNLCNRLIYIIIIPAMNPKLVLTFFTSIWIIFMINFYLSIKDRHLKLEIQFTNNVIPSSRK